MTYIIFTQLSPDSMPSLYSRDHVTAIRAERRSIASADTLVFLFMHSDRRAGSIMNTSTIGLPHRGRLSIQAAGMQLTLSCRYKAS